MKGCVKEFITIILFITILGIPGKSFSATLTWTNGAGDGRASNAANWVTGVVPQDGDRIVFDSTAIDDCIWDLPVTLNNMHVSAGYSGTITLSLAVTLTLDKTITWSGGGDDNLASNPANWSDNIAPVNGDKVVFNDDSAENCIWDINVIPSLFSMTSAYSGTVTLGNNISNNSKC